VASLSAMQSEKVLAVVGNFFDLPLADHSIDVLFASAFTFAELSDLHRALASAIRMLKPGGLLFYFDPVLEQGVLYPLVRNDLDEFLRVARTCTRAGMWHEKDRRYRLYSTRQLEEQLLKHPELEIMERDGISMLPGLVFGGVLQDRPTDDERKHEMKDAILRVLAADLQLYRQVIYICRRKV
jgi:ubiquinone/menaquinone biosynthesis C-methylase UbiE